MQRFPCAVAGTGVTLASPVFSRRHTFVVQVWEPGGSPVLENVRTHERVILSGLHDVGEQIDRWLHTPGEIVADRTRNGSGPAANGAGPHG